MRICAMLLSGVVFSLLKSRIKMNKLDIFTYIYVWNSIEFLFKRNMSMIRFVSNVKHENKCNLCIKTYIKHMPVKDTVLCVGAVYKMYTGWTNIGKFLQNLQISLCLLHIKKPWKSNLLMNKLISLYITFFKIFHAFNQ